jgi:hypothetical protein
MPQDGLFRTQADRRQLRRLICLLAFVLIQFMIHSASNSLAPSVIPTIPAAACQDGRTTKNWEKLLRPRPTLNVCFFALDATGFFDNSFVHAAAAAEIALAMRRRVHTDYCSSQVRSVAKKFHGAFPVGIFQLSVGRTHPAQ